MHHLSPEAAHAITLLLTSTLLGGIIGYERERHERPAGLRTHIVVCVAATLITIVSQKASGDSKITAQIVSGVGFLGAGTILRDSGGSVRGLTTAATLWLVAGIGIAVGYGEPYSLYAAVTTAITLVTLILFGKLESLLGRTRIQQEVTMLFGNSEDQLQAVARLFRSIRDAGASIRRVDTSDVCGGQLIKISLVMPRSVPRERLDDLLAKEDSVITYDWTEE